MSILEIVLYSIISLLVALYIARGVYQIVDRKKHPEKYKKKKEKEDKELDE